MPQTIRTLVLDETGSTNREALARAAEGETGPLWIMARRQTAGRGRSGRSWASERGNLYATLLTRIACPAAAVAQVSLVAGVAVHDAIAAAGGRVPPGLRLKWPNDVLIGRAKCAGILAESVLGQNAATVAVGVGINLAWHPGDLDREATHLAAHGIDVSPEAMLELLAAAMDRRMTQWSGGAGFAATRAAWLERAGSAGEACSVNMGGEVIAGAFAGLDDSGALLVDDDTGSRRTVTFGDVSLPTVAEAGAA